MAYINNLLKIFSCTFMYQQGTLDIDIHFSTTAVSQIARVRCDYDTWHHILRFLFFQITESHRSFFLLVSGPCSLHGHTAEGKRRNAAADVDAEKKRREEQGERDTYVFSMGRRHVIVGRQHF